MRKPLIALHVMHGLIAASVVLMAAAPSGGMVYNYSSDIPPVSTASAQVKRMTAGMDCTGSESPFLTDNIFVVTLDTDKVSKVTFSQALSLTKTGTVKVLAYCE